MHLLCKRRIHQCIPYFLEISTCTPFYQRMHASPEGTTKMPLNMESSRGTYSPVLRYRHRSDHLSATLPNKQIPNPITLSCSTNSAPSCRPGRKERWLCARRFHTGKVHVHGTHPSFLGPENAIRRYNVPARTRLRSVPHTHHDSRLTL